MVSTGCGNYKDSNDDDVPMFAECADLCHLLYLIEIQNGWEGVSLVAFPAIFFMWALIKRYMNPIRGNERFDSLLLDELSEETKKRFYKLHQTLQPKNNLKSNPHNAEALENKLQEDETVRNFYAAVEIGHDRALNKDLNSKSPQRSFNDFKYSYDHYYSPFTNGNALTTLGTIKRATHDLRRYLDGNLSLQDAVETKLKKAAEFRSSLFKPANPKLNIAPTQSSVAITVLDEKGEPNQPAEDTGKMTEPLLSQSKLKS